MPAEVLFYFFQHKNAQVRLRFQIVFQCAPLLKGMRVSCGIMLENSLYYGLESVLKDTGITYKKLLETGDRIMVLFYREKELGEYLNRIGTRSFLRDYGYEEMGLSKMLDRLVMRAALFAEKQIGFPHEIGIFLGYPLEDVKGFIENEGKRYVLSRYWKVYSDPARAEWTFHQYDEAKNRAVNEFLTGMNIRGIIKNKL